ncbi:MAG: hypothetical protein ACLTBP_03745 [Frisingicoccus sp.]
MMMKEIQEIKGREVLDSRGNPTVEVESYFASWYQRTGYRAFRSIHRIYEALELRDGDKALRR